jgi:tight adherence protein B
MIAAEPVFAATLIATSCASAACALRLGGSSARRDSALDRRAGQALRGSLLRWQATIVAVSRDGSMAPVRLRRRLWLAASAAGAVCGFSVLAAAGAVIGAAAGPYAMKLFLRSRRERFAARIDECAAEFALALAAALAGGNSVRGALLVSARAIPEPLAGELDRACVDVTLGQNVEDALATLRSRTASPRIEALAGAIELHRSSGGDLVRLMRELAAAFRSRDIAKRDAKAATAQARFTAIVVAAIPLTLAVVSELARPGSVSGAFAFAPSALMMVLALVLIASGCVLCARIGKVR